MLNSQWNYARKNAHFDASESCLICEALYKVQDNEVKKINEAELVTVKPLKQ